MEADDICIRCGNKAMLVKGKFTMFNGHVVLDDTGYKCGKCGEKFYTSAQVRAMEKQLHEKYEIRRTVIETGRSLAITLPADFVEFYKLRKGSPVVVIPEGKKEARLVFG